VRDDDGVERDRMLDDRQTTGRERSVDLEYDAHAALQRYLIALPRKDQLAIRNCHDRTSVRFQ
jgi:hypothetical protein